VGISTQKTDCERKFQRKGETEHLVHHLKNGLSRGRLSVRGRKRGVVSKDGFDKHGYFERHKPSGMSRVGGLGGIGGKGLCKDWKDGKGGSTHGLLTFYVTDWTQVFRRSGFIGGREMGGEKGRGL